MTLSDVTRFDGMHKNVDIVSNDNYFFNLKN